ncbi:Protein CBG22267 [Caenorhabditis briggsae]|uniref:NudC domain-containing protein 1 n=1 Tax=Caenorhabditis briggsae TaxID=6238 RepID=A8Y1X8_CAEBR|nr:Protein CBG22267 [Caenorhabditis briggsae]CAP38898.1 Protein CBG22267 [Caenorhabditis briggsae]
MQHIRLAVDHSKLDSKFDGYKVSMDNIHFESKQLPQRSCLRSPTNIMVSLQHMKVFSNDNQLFCNVEKCTESHEYLYRILDTGHIQELAYDKRSRQWKDMIIGNIDIGTDSSPAFPTGLIFTDFEFYVASNGISDISVHLGTEVMLKRTFEGAKGICLIEAKVIENKLNILAYSVENSEENDRKTTKTRSRIYWIVVNLLDFDCTSNLTIEKETQFIQNGHFETCTFSSDGNLIFLASEKPRVDGEQVTVLNHTWSQTGATIEVKFTLTGGSLSQEDVDLNVSKSSVKLAIQDVVVLNGTLGGEIDENDVEIAMGQTEKSLTLKLKSTSDKKWEKLIGLETSRMEKVENEEMGKMGASEEPMEECDEADKALLFYWVNRQSGKTIAQCDVSGSQSLFVRRNRDQPADFCLRHDVDGLLWSFAGPAPCHVATLQAFGYVQASKTTRLWSGCSPNNTMACIIEGNNRVLLYSQKVEVFGSLSNRKTSQTVNHVAKQHLLRLECPDPIRGVHMTNTHLFVATKEHIHVAELPV